MVAKEGGLVAQSTGFSIGNEVLRFEASVSEVPSIEVLKGV